MLGFNDSNSPLGSGPYQPKDPLGGATRIIKQGGRTIVLFPADVGGGAIAAGS